MINRKIKITNEAVAKYKEATIDDALLQAIYNGIDADASKVSIRALSRKGEDLDLGDDNAAITAIEISDDGIGIPYTKVEEYFQQLERSWKKDAKRGNNTPYHGSKGCGRFKCFALGEELKWKTVYRDSKGALLEYSMTLDVHEAKRLNIDENPQPSSCEQTGTVLTINGLTQKFMKHYARLDALRFDVLTGLIVDVEVYKKKIEMFGVLLDPQPLKAKETEFQFSYVDNENKMQGGKVRLLAWKYNAEFINHKHTFYYKPDGGFFCKRPSGLFADTHYPAHTLIITSDVFNKCTEFDAPFNVFGKIDEAIRGNVIRFLVGVKQDEFSDVLGEIFENENYPYKHSPRNALDAAKETAYNAALGALVFENSSVVSPKKKAILKVIFPLLNRLMSGDYLLGDNIDKILALDATDAMKYNRMVSRIKLSNIINHYNILLHRYAFLESLNKLVHIEEYSEDLLERAQLHKIVAEEPWVFGPQYERGNLITSDKSLCTFLRKAIRRNDLLIDVDEDNVKIKAVEDFILKNKNDISKCLKKIPDLVLAKPVMMPIGNVNDVIEYLIIELKRPTVRIDFECRNQAQEIFTGVYNATNGGGIMIDEKHRWRYCLVSSGVADELTPEFDREGHLKQLLKGNYVIDVWTWDTIIDQARKRLDVEAKGIEVELASSDCDELIKEYRKRFGVKKRMPK